MPTIRIALVQTNPTVGDLAGNRETIIAYIGQAKKLGADVVVFPELAVTGYPPEDLLLKPQFVKDNRRTLKEIQKATNGITAIVGFVDANNHIYNAAAVLDNSKHVYTYHKILLPNYGVFDEYRYFKPGTRYPVFLLNGAAFGVNICEDIWFDHGPTRVQARAGAELIININASPYHKGRGKERKAMLAERAREDNVIITYTNMVGGQDELVFDGHSIVIDKKGNMLTFLIQKADHAFANSMRRMIIDEVPTMAIEDVEFKKNDSILYDEIVAHRLGLIPLSTNLQDYNLTEKCTCKGAGCAKCQLDLTLKTKASGVIDASKIKSKDPKVVPVYDEMIITKLMGNLVVKAVLGR